MKATNKGFGSIRFLAVFCAAIAFCVCLAADFGRPGGALAGEAADGGEPAPTATSTGTAPAPPTGTGTTKPPAATSTATATGTGTGTSTAPPKGTATAKKAPPGPKVTPEIRDRIALIIDEIIKKHEGRLIDLFPLEEELAKMGLPAVEELVRRMSLELDSPISRAVAARAIARVTGWYMPHSTSRDVESIRTWWVKNRLKKADELKKDRLKELTSQAKDKKVGKYIELYRIADALGYIKDPEAVQTIRLLLGPDYKDSLLKRKLLIALGKQNSADTISIVIPYLKSNDDKIIISAITSLGLTGSVSAQQHITPFVKSVKTPFRLCLLYTSPSPRDVEESRMPSSA